jgi:hypothetical protein
MASASGNERQRKRKKTDGVTNAFETTSTLRVAGSIPADPDTMGP